MNLQLYSGKELLGVLKTTALAV